MFCWFRIWFRWWLVWFSSFGVYFGNDIFFWYACDRIVQRIRGVFEGFKIFSCSEFYSSFASLIHPPTHSLTHSPTHPLTHPPTHSPPQRPTPPCPACACSTVASTPRAWWSGWATTALTSSRCREAQGGSDGWCTYHHVTTRIVCWFWSACVHCLDAPLLTESKYSVVISTQKRILVPPIYRCTM